MNASRCSNRNRRSARAANRVAFSLLEVLISLAIFGAVIAVLGQLLANGGKTSVRARLETQAIFRAESVMAELSCAAIPFQAVREAAFADDSKWRYSASLQATQEQGLFLVIVSITRPDQPGIELFALPRYMRDPMLVQQLQATTEQREEQRRAEEEAAGNSSGGSE
jgi:type II secretory pathway pseudopilin PulG